MGINRNHWKRLRNLEQRIGPPPPTIVEQVRHLAFREITDDELSLLIEQTRQLEKDASFKPSQEFHDIDQRFNSSADAVAMKMTGKSFLELLKEEAQGQQ